MKKLEHLQYRAGGSFYKYYIPRLAESIKPQAVAEGFLQRDKRED
jgi:hypothetical protein